MTELVEVTLSPNHLVTESPNHPVTLSRHLLPLLLLALLLSGCARLRRTSTNVALDLTAFLPSGWQALGALQEVNIDGDVTTEYLLLYTYDPVLNGIAGPVGALILDPQTEAVLTDTNVSILVRPTGFPNPHALLPSYWPGAGQGFIAPPDQAGNITVHQVTYLPSGDGLQAPPVDTLIIRGGPNYLTFVWWKDEIEGYGVNQLYAPGGFEGVDWATWQQTPTRLDSLIGVTPLHDRSLLCRKTLYQRLEASPVAETANDYRPAIAYEAGDLGLSFCFGIPEHPFYAEGVVMAYLQDAGKRPNLITTPNDSAALARLNEVFDPATIVLIDDVFAYQELPFSVYDRANPDNVLPTTACALVRAQPAVAGGPLEPFWLHFTLRHQSPRLTPPTPDRLLVDSLEALRLPGGSATQNCVRLIGATK